MADRQVPKIIRAIPGELSIQAGQANQKTHTAVMMNQQTASKVPPAQPPKAKQ